MSTTTNSTTVSPIPIPTSPMPTPFVYQDDGFSGGSVFCLLFFLAAGIYFGGGIVLRKYLRGADGYEMIPHYSFWVDLPNLVREGLAFAMNGCQPVMSYDRI